MSAANTKSVPGLILSSDRTSYSFAPNDLPASDHYFRANFFKSKIEFGELVLLFGQVSSFSNEERFKAAVEISFPIKLAVDILVRNIWDNPSMDGVSVFMEILEKHLETFPAYQYKDGGGSRDLVRNYDLPLDTSTYRAFSANFVSASLSHGQAMLEFFEASPNLLANLVHSKNLRPNDGLKPVLAIILPPDVLAAFFRNTKNLLEPYLDQGE